MSPAAAAWVPLPLVVSAAADGTLAVPDATRAFLRTLTAPTVRVLGVLGPPHTGKRLLLTTLLHADAGAFSAQPLDTAEHVLVWLWHAPNAANSDDARLVLSANTAAENEQHARRARALLLLLSSTLLYNDDGEIDAAALERLAWVREIASSLRIKPNQDDDGVAADFHQHAPAFIWVQQNAKIKWLTDADTGDKMTATQYLNKCLAEEAGFSDAVAARNEQRMYFHSIFKKCACVALSRAVEGGAAASFSLPRDQLRGQFIEAIETQLFTPLLSARSGHQLPTKTVLGREIRGDQFGHVVDAYVSAWNANAVPAIQTAANALLQHDVEDAFEQARQAYEQELKTIVLDEEDAAVQPTDARALSLAHWRGLERALICLQPLQAQLPETTKKTLFQNGLVTLQSEFAARLDNLQTRNAALSASLCERLLKELLPANLEMIAQALESRPRDAFSDGLLGLLTQYKSDLRDAVDAYKTQGAGPALYASLVNALLASVFDSIKTYGASVLRQYQQHMRAFQEQRAGLDQELALAQQQDTSAAFSADDQKKLYEEQLEQSTQQLSELRRALQGELNAKKNELDRLMGDMTTMDAKHEVRIQTMTSDLAWVRSRTEELEKQAMADRQRLEETMTGATDEMLAKERTHHKEERTLFAQQKELLARVVELERELVQKKTRHVQQVFAIESDHAKRVDELKQEQAEFARQLRSQAKTDTGVLKLAYTKKKAVVQADMDRVAREIQELEEKLQAYESQNSARAAKSPTGTKTPLEATTTTATAPKLESAFAVVSALRTSSREFLFKSPDAESPPAVGATRGTRSDTEMCKAQ